MFALNGADIGVIILVTISTLIGLYRGILRELLTILTWIVAALIAYAYGDKAGEYFTFVESGSVKLILGMLALFISVVLLGFIIKLIVCKAAKFSGATPLDRICGLLFGMLRGCALVMVFLLLSANVIPTQSWYQKSQLLPRFATSAGVVVSYMPGSWNDYLKHQIKSFNSAKDRATA